MTGSGHMAVGGVFDMATGAGTATQIAAENNYDATFLDATHYVVNGAPSTGQGLYRTTVGGTTFTRAVSHLGEYSGSVEVFGPERARGRHVLRDELGGRHDGRPRARSRCGGRGQRDDRDRRQHGDAADDALVVRAPLGRGAQRARTTERRASTRSRSTRSRALRAARLTVATSPNLTTGGDFTSVAAAGNDIVLGFTGGLLFVH